jgi:protein-tyrosine-phosphatase
MAEGFARNLGTESLEVVSAGLESSNVNPTPVDVMREPDGKPIEEFRAARDAIKQHVLELLESQKMLTKPSVSI